MHVPALVSNLYSLTTISVVSIVVAIVAIVAIVAVAAGQRIALASQRSMPKRCGDNKSRA